jgi:dTDP-glucose 4,6-dehydratase
LGWSPSVSLEQGLQAKIDWYKHNQGWWKSIKEKNQAYFTEQYGTT